MNGEKETWMEGGGPPPARRRRVGEPELVMRSRAGSHVCIC